MSDEALRDGKPLRGQELLSAITRGEVVVGDDRVPRWTKPATPTAPANGTVSHLRSTDGCTPYGRRALEDECAIVRSTSEGSRNDALNRAAYRMGRLIPEHLTVEVARDALEQAGRACGLPQSEIELVLRTDNTAGLNQGQSAPRQVAPLDDVPTVTVLANEADFWQERELLSHIHTFARARCVAPWAVLGATLARIVAATAPHIVIPPIVGGYASLNLFVGLIGRSGSGKGAAESVAAEALDVGHLEIRNTGSGEGALHAYVKRTREGLEQHTDSVLFSIPEIDSLGAVGARQGSTLLPLLRSAWSGEQLGFTYADPDKNLIVRSHHYRMCIVAGVQPERAGSLLDDADGGTPQRFLWLPAIDPNAPDEMPEAPEPMSWIQPKPGFTNPRGLNTMTVCETACDMIRENRLKSVRGEGDALDGHALLTRLKVAAALALADGRLNVTDDDWRLSGYIADVSAATRGAVVERIKSKAAEVNKGRALAEADRAITVEQVREEKRWTRVRATLIKALAKHGEMSRAKLRGRAASADRDVADDAIDALVEEGRIEAIDIEYHGQSGTVLRLVKS